MKTNNNKSFNKTRLPSLSNKTSLGLAKDGENKGRPSSCSQKVDELQKQLFSKLGNYEKTAGSRKPYVTKIESCQ